MRVAAVEHDVGADELPRCLVRGHGQVHGHVIAAREDGGAAGQRRARAHEAARHLGGAQREVAVIHALVLVGGRQLGQREDLQRDVAQLGHGEAAGGDVLQVDALVLAKHSSVNIRFSWSCVIRQKMRVREERQRTRGLKSVMWERSRLTSLQRGTRREGEGEGGQDQ